MFYLAYLAEYLSILCFRDQSEIIAGDGSVLLSNYQIYFHDKPTPLSLNII